ncbi:hypothetical protein CHN50_17805 [Priestia aryabhattai]|nr:hypothetical protein CHN50_17805 [Priestia aryabhattai]
MKPITLTIAGLHSFRSKQIIDFTSLCSGGVFGIFGPTGSGKSSILDAMTLALYGKVERAANNTHGILNHAEDEVKVAFTFELENATHKKRYTVERSFKRSDEMRVRSATSRFIEVGDETIVLADKTNDVNQQVQSLLGLTIDDFTRAVVLPQGKFAEFLSLKGTERRQMLQRLFNLEQYGDQLNKKIRSKVQLLKGEIDTISAEQTGLGEASEESVKQAEQVLQERIILLEKRERELKDIETLYDEQTAIWNDMQIKHELEETLKGLKEQEGLIEGKRKQVAIAEEAKKLLPYLNAYEQLTMKKQRTRQNVLVIQEKLRAQYDKYEKSQIAYDQARLTKQQEQPKLFIRKEQLEQAKKIQKSIRELEKKYDEKEKECNQLSADVKEQVQILQKLEEQLEKGKLLQSSLKEELEQVKVSDEEREQTYEATVKAEKVMELNKIIKEHEEKVNKKQLDLKAAEAKLATQKELKQRQTSQAQQLFVSTQRIYHVVCEREREFEQFFRSINRQLQSLREQQVKERINHLAHQLAEDLSEGKPCPVCGSMDHPSPAVSSEGHANLKLDEHITSYEEEKHVLDEQKQEYGAMKLRLEQLHSMLLDAYPGITDTKYDLPVIQLLEGNGDEYSTKLKVELKALQQDYIEVREKQTELLQSYKQSEQQQQDLLFSMQQLIKEVEGLAEELSKYQNDFSVLIEEWNELYPHLEMSKIYEVQEKMKVRIAEERTLVERINKSYQFFDEQQNKIAYAREGYDQATRKNVQLEAEQKNVHQALQQQKQMLMELSKAGDVASELREVEQRIIELDQTENTCYEMLNSMQVTYQKLQANEHAERKVLEDLTERYEEVKKDWEEHLQPSCFSEKEEVKKAVQTSDDIQKLTEEIQAFEDKLKQAKADIAKVEGKLNGKSITQDNWEETKSLLVNIKAAVNEANQLKGGAEETLKDMLKRHERFKELEKQRVEKEALFEQYQKLQSVFKGNTFVEYMAEEQLMAISRDASERLAILTRHRYAIEVDSQGGFIMRDDANGGVKRPVSTLSGGETFLTSLALALSLSAQIQLRGEYPLQFFFLDEGFGTLDGELLDTVVTALEKLQSDNLSIGVISHVQELRARLPKRLIVQPADATGMGTKVAVETL